MHRQVAPIADIYEVPWEEFERARDFVEQLEARQRGGR